LIPKVLAWEKGFFVCVYVQMLWAPTCQGSYFWKSDDKATPSKAFKITLKVQIHRM